MAPTPSELYPPQHGDFLIQTSDAVLFGVHRLLLKLASPVMSDMFALGDIEGSQPTPNAPVLMSMFALGNIKGSQPMPNTPVLISEDSETFQNLLSFIYPDKTPTVLTSCDAMLPVCSAAVKYEMKVVVDALQMQIVSKRIIGKSYREALLYADPLRIFVKAKELGLDDLAKAAANATLNIDISAVPINTRSDLASMPVVLLWQLLDLRKERATWLLEKCGSVFYIKRMKPKYDYGSPSTAICKCGAVAASTSGIPALLRDMIKAYPCARAIRRINFNKELGCLRCGGAAIAHFNKICDEYEKTFGIF